MRRAVVLLVAALVAGGCRSPRSEAFEALVAMPRPAPPPLPQGQGPAPDSRPVPEPPAGSAWARIDLGAVLALAGAGSMDVLRARERLAESSAAEDEAVAGLLPRLRPGVTFRRHRGQIQATEGQFLDVTRQDTAAGLRAELVLRPGEAVFDIEAAGHRVAAEEEGVEESIQGSMLRGALLYLDLLASVEDVEIARDGVGHAGGLAAFVQARHDAGLMVRADLDRALAEAAARRVALAETDAAFVRASTELARHLRLDPATTLYPAETALVTFRADPDAPADELIRTALLANPSVKRVARFVAEAASREDRAAIAPWIPALEIGVDLAERGENFGRFGGSEDVFAMVTWELRGLGFGQGAALRGAEARHRRARLDLADAREAVAAAVVATRADLDLRRRALEASEAGIAAAAAALDRSRARLESGQGLLVDVLGAEATLAAARRARLRAVIGFNRSVLTLRTLLGGRPLP